MRKLAFAAALLSTALVTPALARDGSAYAGIDAGIIKPNALDLKFVNSTTSISDAMRLRHNVGYDVDGVFGYDFGMFRLEAELGYKHTQLKDATLSQAVLNALLQPTQPLHYTSTGEGNFTSGMINALVDLGPEDSFNGSIGVGIGGTHAKYDAGLAPTSNTLDFSSSDNALAFQALAEVRAPISRNIDVGVKYRYFRTARLDFGTFCETTCPSVSPFDLKDRFVSHSFLASFVYNLTPPAPPPAPPPPPPPPPPPATQTCPDGTVIAATATCPALPPPPPPPPPAPERGL